MKKKIPVHELPYEEPDELDEQHEWHYLNDRRLYEPLGKGGYRKRRLPSAE